MKNVMRQNEPHRRAARAQEGGALGLRPSRFGPLEPPAVDPVKTANVK